MRKPHLTAGEEVILRKQSCISTTCSTWKPGFLYLTNNGLIFTQPSGRVVFGTLLDKVVDVKIVKGKFILNLKRRFLRVLYESAISDKTLQAFFAVNNPDQWEKATREAIECIDRARRTPLEIFDENDHVVVVAELPGLEKDDIKINVGKDKLTISVDTPRQRYYKETKLPVSVKAKPIETTYKNGVLEVKLEKSDLG